MADDQIAATLAAALITVGGKDIAKVKGTPAEVAVEIYFQCVEALKAAKKKRNKTVVKALSI